MSFLIVGFPAFKPSDLDCIQAFRKEHDPLYGVVDPHFTILFPVEDDIIPVIRAEMTAQWSEMKKIEFTLSKAIAHQDEVSPAFFTFLAPNDGYISLRNLHDKIYSGVLNPYLRLDIDYLPHITIGQSQDIMKCTALVDTWNDLHYKISGSLSELTLLEYKSQEVEIISTLKLK